MKRVTAKQGEVVLLPYSRVSSTNVTGPSFTSSTAILAPKLPVCVGTPTSRIAPANASTSGSGGSGAAA